MFRSTAEAYLVDRRRQALSTAHRLHKYNERRAKYERKGKSPLLPFKANFWLRVLGCIPHLAPNHQLFIGDAYHSQCILVPILCAFVGHAAIQHISDDLISSLIREVLILF